MAKFTCSDTADNINGTNGADQIFGRGGDDNLVGLKGNDVIEGGAGADGTFGSTGFDYTSYRGSAACVYVSLTDLLGHYDAEGDHLYGIEGVIGSAHADVLVGGEAGDLLYGEDGADHLGGLDGNDKLNGGKGNDLLEGGFGDDQLDGGAGIDTASLYNYGSEVVADLVQGTADGTATRPRPLDRHRKSDGHALCRPPRRRCTRQRAERHVRRGQPHRPRRRRPVREPPSLRQPLDHSRSHHRLRSRAG